MRSWIAVVAASLILGVGTFALLTSSTGPDPVVADLRPPPDRCQALVDAVAAGGDPQRLAAFRMGSDQVPASFMGSMTVASVSCLDDGLTERVLAVLLELADDGGKAAGWMILAEDEDQPARWEEYLRSIYPEPQLAAVVVRDHAVVAILERPGAAALAAALEEPGGEQRSLWRALDEMIERRERAGL